MITLYGMPSPNVLNLLMLEEAGLPYENSGMWRSFAGRDRRPGFARWTPFGKVPVIIDRTNGGQTYTVGVRRYSHLSCGNICASAPPRSRSGTVAYP